jgi:hypothetical protein
LSLSPSVLVQYFHYFCIAWTHLFLAGSKSSRGHNSRRHAVQDGMPPSQG